MSESIYKSYEPEQLEELFSQFLVDRWSYSAITSFARNEKAFEMGYIFGIYSRRSASSVAGNAYHDALMYYFMQKQQGETVDLPELEMSAFAYIENVPANQWKIQKTTPTIEECQKKAISIVTSLLKNFYSELSTYESELKEILAIEMHVEEFVTVNGVDIPIPCKGVIDLVIRTKDDKLVLIDHKSQSAYTSDDEIALSIGTQAMTYILAFESKTGMTVDEVWFVENKYSQNKDKSPQLHCFKCILNENTRKIYEALLYEPLKRMVEAVNNPDYVYLINEADNYVDKAELYDFWARTMICEVEEFNVDPTKKKMVEKRLKKVRDASLQSISPQVIKNFKESAASFIQYDLTSTNMTQEEKIEHVLRTFGTIVKVAHKFEGFSSNTYLLEVSAGVKVSSIYSRRLDLANALDVSNVRLSKEMVVHEGRSYLAIDFSKKRETDLFFDPAYLTERKIPIGKDNLGNIIVWDLENESTPHMLVCGATGSGKSVSLKSTIEYALLAAYDVVILDPKVKDFKGYKGHEKVTVINDITEIEEKMAWLVDEMNRLIKEGKETKTLVVFDEFADALANSRKGSELDIKEMVQVGSYAPKKGPLGFPMPAEPKMKLMTVGTRKSLEENLRILLQKGRSLGFRIVAATQRASVKVITGDAKVNFPVQVCFRVPKAIDSKVVLDEEGAEALAGKGDGLMRSPEYNEVVRFQAFYKPDAEPVTKPEKAAAEA